MCMFSFAVSGRTTPWYRRVQTSGNQRTLRTLQWMRTKTLLVCRLSATCAWLGAERVHENHAVHTRSIVTAISHWASRVLHFYLDMGLCLFAPCHASLVSSSKLSSSGQRTIHDVTSCSLLHSGRHGDLCCHRASEHWLRNHVLDDLMVDIRAFGTISMNHRSIIEKLRRRLTAPHI